MLVNRSHYSGETGGGSNMWGALIGAGATIGGGLLDHFLNKDSSDDAFEKSLHHSKRAIRDRVRDAELAGIHPLYALGASTSTPSPMVFESRLGESMSRAGQDVSNVVSRQMDKEGRRRAILEEHMLAAQIAKLQAEKNLVDQEALRLLDQNRGPGSIHSFDPGRQGIGGQQDSGLYDIVPPDRSTTRPGEPGIEAGPSPAFKPYTLPGLGLEVLLPAGTDVGETLENVKWYMWPTIYAVNKRYYGKEHADKLLKWANPFK